jgi:mono/diheme cytochrome c family protein
MIGGQPATAVPFAETPELLALGKKSFGVFCAACHGAAGFGGSVVASNMVGHRPPSLHSALVRALPAGTIFRVATDGVGAMPPYAWQLSNRERWAVVAYVRQLEYTSPSDSAGVADSLRALSFVSDSARMRQ